MKTWKWTGIVSRQSQQTVQKSKLEGQGKKAHRVTVEEEVFSVVVQNEVSKDKLRLSQIDKPFDMTIGEVVTVQVGYGAQQTLEEVADKKKGKA